MAIALASASIMAPAIAGVRSLGLEDYLAEVEALSQAPTDPEMLALEAVLGEVTNPLSEVDVQVASEPVSQRWTGRDFTEAETRVLNYFQDYGITDRAALAVLLGNAKQESRFETNICEGGHRGPYHTCRRGGFGLIQWTTQGRYSGLGRHARSQGTKPEHIETQLSYLTTEVEWKKVEHIFKSEGRSISSYMQAAYRWLGWGVHGNRTLYAQDYFSRLSLNTD